MKRLTDAANGETKVRVTDCLGPCERANVVVVPTDEKRVWLGEMVSDERVDALVDWLKTGGTLPPVLDDARFPAPRPSRGPRGKRVDVDLVALAKDPNVAWTIGVDGAVFELMPGHDATITLDTDDGVGAFRIDGPEGAPSLVLLARHTSKGATSVEPVDTDQGRRLYRGRRVELFDTTGGWHMRTSVATVTSASPPKLDPGILELDRALPEQSGLPSGWVLGAAAWISP